MLENNFYLLEQKELSLYLRDVSLQNTLKGIQTPCLMYNTYDVVNYIITKQLVRLVRSSQLCPIC